MALDNVDGKPSLLPPDMKFGPRKTTTTAKSQEVNEPKPRKKLSAQEQKREELAHSQAELNDIKMKIELLETQLEQKGMLIDENELKKYIENDLNYQKKRNFEIREQEKSNTEIDKIKENLKLIRLKSSAKILEQNILKLEVELGRKSDK